MDMLRLPLPASGGATSQCMEDYEHEHDDDDKGNLDSTNDLSLHPYDDWLVAVQKGSNILQKLAHADLSKLGADHGVSIVYFPPSVNTISRISLVHWHDASRNLGRETYLDTNNCVVPIVCVGDKQHPDDIKSLGGIIIWPNTNAHHVRRSKQLRKTTRDSQLSDELVLLILMLTDMG